MSIGPVVTRDMEDRVSLSPRRSRWRLALLSATAAWATLAAAGLDAGSAAAATGHGSGGAAFAAATGTTTSQTGTQTQPTVTFPGTTPPTTSPTVVAPTGTAAGAIVSIDANSFTIQTPGTGAGVINEMTDYASALTAKDYPYVWGGGHARAEVASVGDPGPGHNGKRKGFDCSGTVAAVLAAGGLWPKSQGVPNDAGVIRYLEQQKLIASGPGTGTDEVTLYDNPGVHIFMNIDGRFFGTSDGGGGGDAAGGPGWLSDGAADALNSKAFKRYHLVPAALNDSGSYLHDITFQYAGGEPGATTAVGLSLGAGVKVSYAEAGDGALNMGTVSYTGSATVSGTVTSVVSTGSQFTLKTNAGKKLTMYAPDPTVTSGLLPGEAVTVTYTKQAATKTTPAELVVHSLTVTSSAPPTATTPTGTTPTGTTTTPTGITTTPTGIATTPTSTLTTPANTGTTSTTAYGGAATGTLGTAASASGGASAGGAGL